MVKKADNQKSVKILYVNWEGEERVRTILPERIWYGKTEWHKEEQWLLHALDLEKNEYRDFAMKDVKKWGV